MPNFQYQWNDKKDKPYIVRYDPDTGMAEDWNSKRREWAPSVDLLEYFNGMDNSLTPISAEEVARITSS